MTDLERALVAEAIAAGKLQRIPTGVTTQPTYVWDGKELVQTGGVDISIRAAMKNAIKRRKRSPVMVKAMQDRAAIRLMHAEGKTTREMATITGLSIQTVRTHLARVAA